MPISNNDESESPFLLLHTCNRPLDNIPLMPLAELSIDKDKIGGDDWMEWESWAHKELMSVGSDLRAKFSNLQVLQLLFFILFYELIEKPSHCSLIL